MEKLEGKIGSCGECSGLALVSNNPGENSSYRDYVLVTDNPNPKMSYLIHGAIGIVTGEGGLMSHLAVVAREMQIPCILNCPEAYQEIKFGEKVRILANNQINQKGTVEYDN